MIEVSTKTITTITIIDDAGNELSFEVREDFLKNVADMLDKRVKVYGVDCPMEFKTQMYDDNDSLMIVARSYEVAY